MRKELSYSVWLVPTGRNYQRFSSIINSISREYNLPLFIPHVTLIGGFDGDEKYLLHKTEELSMRLKPFSVRLTHVDYLNEFFRSLFIRVEKTPVLMHAYEIANSVFGFEENPNYLPHMSLLYGNLSLHEKEKIINKIGKNFDMDFMLESLHFVHNNERDKIWTDIKEFSLK